MNPSVMGEGITCLASYIVYFSRSWKLSDRIQSLGRSHRPGAEKIAKNVTVIDLIVSDSIDQSVFQALEKKEDLLEGFRVEKVRGMV